MSGAPCPSRRSGKRSAGICRSLSARDTRPQLGRPEFASMTLCETASSRFVKQLGYLTLLYQACQTLSIVCVALGIGREVPVRLLLSAGHWAPPFQCRPLFGPTVSPRLRSEVPQYAG